MWKVLLIEDNRMAMRYLQNLIDWEEEGFQIVATAFYGEEGIEKFHRYHPDIVITDIQMPGMSGIEVADEIRKCSSETVILFLSSYHEFEYARSALALSVKDYLLKDELEEEELKNKLGIIRKELERRQTWGREERERKLLEKWKQQKADFSDMAEKREKFACVLIEQDEVLPVFCIVSGKNWIKESESDEIKKICYGSMPDQTWAVIKLAHARHLALIKMTGMYHRDERTDRLKRWAAKIKKELALETRADFSIFIFTDYADLAECAALYREKEQEIGRKYFKGISNVLWMKESGAKRKMENMVSVPTEKWKRFIDSFQKRKIEKEEIGRIVENMYQESWYEESYQKFSEVTGRFLYFLSEKYESGKMAEKLFKDSEVYLWMDAEGIQRWIERKLILCYQEQREQRKYSKIVRQSQEYVALHYQRPELNIGEISEKIGLTPNYVNNLFRKETGKSLGQYITDYRMEMAKKLICEGEMKMYEIAVAVGYPRNQYFSVVFKKETGYTPMEYKQKIENEEMD